MSKTATLTRRRRDDVEPEWHRTERRSWHFDKRLSVDTVVGVLGVGLVVGGPVLVWGRAMESRVQEHEVLQVLNDPFVGGRPRRALFPPAAASVNTSRWFLMQ